MIAVERNFLFMTVSPLFTILGFLLSRATTVRTGYILLFLGFCLHFVGLRVALGCFSKDNATF